MARYMRTKPLKIEELAIAGQSYSNLVPVDTSATLFAFNRLFLNGLNGTSCFMNFW